MNIDEIYILEDRGFVFINGEDAKDFLQNIITNNINAVTDNNSSFASILLTLSAMFRNENFEKSHDFPTTLRL